MTHSDSHANLELRDSILRRLPPGLSPVQVAALDVVSNAADIISLSGQRLRQTLTDIALDKRATSLQIASAFSDAWSIVDAVDRIRAMVKLLHKHLGPQFKEFTKDFEQQTQSIRELRNLTDHLPQRIQSVLSSNMPAFGRLSWVTVTSTRSGLVCTLDPGTARAVKKSMSLPDVGGRSIVLPTGAILLSAASTKAWLEDASMSVNHLVGALEQYVERVAQAGDIPRIEAPRDFLVIGEISFPEDISPRSDSAQGSLF